ncbi:hypothetical protein ACLQ2R_00715 [Streptosporangium sp. DT93]|uniref:hypothetical protein n=1 Tax=Streptosporangium sp. DT93 TaxID=3393428 RepID=UPI003CEF5933
MSIPEPARTAVSVFALLVGVSSIGSAALVAGGFQAAENKDRRRLGGPFTTALVGIGFVLSAGVVAPAEPPDPERSPQARVLRPRPVTALPFLRVDRLTIVTPTRSAGRDVRPAV